MADQNFQRRPQHILNDYRYPLPRSEKPVEGAKFPAMWTWQFLLSGKIAFKVEDGVWGEQDRNKKVKEFEFSMDDRNMFLDVLEEAVNNTEFTSYQFPLKYNGFNMQTKRPNEVASTVGTMTIIRTEEGKIRVGYARGDYKVMFLFQSPHDAPVTIKKKDGTVFEDHGMMSRAYTRWFIRFTRENCDKYELENYKPREKKENNNNNNSNNNWGGKQQSQQQQPASNDFDDIDW